MDLGRNDMLAELANDAALERTDFIVQATEQLGKFLDRNRDRISQLGGLTLVDDDPDYLSVAPDGTFRVRSRYEDPDTGEWVTETEIVDTPSELIELYNPAEVFAAFAEAAREAAGFEAEPTATDDLLATAGVAPEETFGLGVEDGYAGAADSWAAGQPPVLEADDEESAALALYNLALDFQERSQQSEARLLDQFEEAASRLTDRLGDLIIVDDDDERLVLGADRPVPRRGPAGGQRRRVAGADGARRARRVLRPDRHLRRPRGRPGGGLPRDRPGDRGRGCRRAAAGEAEPADAGGDDGAVEASLPAATADGATDDGPRPSRSPAARPRRQRDGRRPCDPSPRSSSNDARSCPGAGSRRGTRPRRHGRPRRAVRPSCARSRRAASRSAGRSPSRRPTPPAGC